MGLFDGFHARESGRVCLILNVSERLCALWKVFVAQHLAAPLGAVGSVIAWERVGAAIAFLAQARHFPGDCMMSDALFVDCRSV